MLKAAPSFPPIETWAKMSESDQDAIIQAMEISRRRRWWTVPMLAAIAFGTVIAIVFYRLL